jgi:putative DNA primase/helicase
MIIDHTPVCLRGCRQWVAWKYVVREGRQTKAPVNPHTGGLASSTDPATWGSFEEALAAWQRGSDLAGVGFVFSEDDPYCGVDLDDAVDPDSRTIKSWAKDIVDRLGSYSEISPSGTGVKILLKAIKPGTRCRRSYGDGEVEIYDRRRFFTVTGMRLTDMPPDVQLRQDELDAVYRQVFGDDGLDRTPAATPSTKTAPVTSLSDDEIVRLASSQRRSGAKFATLWAGNWNSHFNSASEADSSVVFTLAFYTKDAAQIDRLFRQSGLMREKWDELHGGETYGESTIAKALERVTRQYEPKRRRVAASSGARSDSGATACGAVSSEPDPGTTDPVTGRLILSTSRTLPTAEAFIKQFYQHADGRTFHQYAGLNMAWRESRYAEVEDNAICHQLLPWMHAAVRMVYDAPTGTWMPVDFPANPRTVRSALDSIKVLTHLPASVVSPSWLADVADMPDPREILPCRSWLLHLPTMTMFPPTPVFFSVNALDYDPDLDAPAPDHWFRFLDQLFGGDTEARELLQDWFGYCLTGDTAQHKMLLMVGPRRSGKGTIARVLAQLVGAGNVCGPTTSSLAGPFGLQPLIGKSLAIVSDARFAGENVQTVVERLLCISGEDTLTIERKHTTAVTMKLPTRFVFLTNELPRLNDASGALAGRFMMLRLTESFYGKEDRSLTRVLLAELPGILNWAIEGWLRLRERGAFVQPKQVEDVIRDMEDLASPVGAFVRDRCAVGVGRRVWIDSIYTAWKEWCEREGRSSVSTKQTFGRDLIAAVPAVSCRRNQFTGRFYEGISLKEGSDF